MSRKLALPLFLLTFALCVIFASRTPQPIIEELPSDAADAPAVQSAKAERPSVLAKLKAPLSQPCAEDKIRHRGKEER